MSTKRKRESEDDESSQLSKQLKQDDVTRSGRVRKKPAKFVEDPMETVDIKPDVAKLPVTPPVSTPPRPKGTQVKLTTVSPVVYATSIKEEPQPVVEDFSSTDEDSGKTPNRSSRARKKSAKVLEMEEFEEAEKKQSTKKDGSKKTKSPVAHGAEISPESTVASIPIPILKIKDIPTLPKIEPMSPVSSQVSPQKSPIASVLKSPIVPASAEKSSGSVIKLLLSSPAQSSKPSLSTSSVAQSEPKSSAKKTKLKSNTASDLAAHLQKTSKIRNALEMPQISLSVAESNLSSLKLSLSTIKQRLNTSLETEVKTEPYEIGDDIKTEPGLEPVAVMPVPTISKEPARKKSSKKALSESDESPFLSPPMPSPNVIHVGSMNMGLEIKAENDSKRKKLKVKTEGNMSDEMLHEHFGLDMPEIELGDAGNDSFIKMEEEEDGLMIPEEEVVTSENKMGKDVKKKTPKGKKKMPGVQLGDIPSTDGELVMDFARMKSEDKKKNKKDKVQKEESAEWLNTGKNKTNPTTMVGFPDPADAPTSSEASITQAANDAAERVLNESRNCKPLKRGRYGQYCDETRANIARCAIDSGVAETSRKFTLEFGRKVSESTVRYMRDQYLKMKEKVGKDSFTLPCTPRGAPTLMGEHDVDVQNWVRKVRVNGGVINVPVVTAAAEAILMKLGKCKLERYGGGTYVTQTYGRSLLRRMGFQKRKGAKFVKQLPPDFDDIQSAFVQKVQTIVFEHQIPDQLVINWDQIGCQLVPGGDWTMDEQGTDQVSVTGLDDRRQITVLLAATKSGSLLPPQLIYTGRTEKCLPKGVDFPESWDITFTDNHSSNEDSMLRYINNVIIPYVDSIRNNLLNGQNIQHAVAMFDIHSANQSLQVIQKLEENGIISVFIPACCTDRLQPLELTVNSEYKESLKRSFLSWYTSQVVELLDDDDHTYVDLKTSTIKPIHATWVITTHSQMETKTNLIKKGFQKAGL